MAGFDYLRMATGDGALRRSLFTGIVVGTILTAINQGDTIVAGEPFPWIKALLNYVVPFCVATYGALSARIAAARNAAG